MGSTASERQHLLLLLQFRQACFRSMHHTVKVGIFMLINKPASNIEYVHDCHCQPIAELAMGMKGLS